VYSVTLTARGVVGTGTVDLELTNSPSHSIRVKKNSEWRACLAKLTRDLEVYSQDKKMIQHSKILKGPEHRSEKKKHPLYVLIKLVSVSTKNGFAAQEEII